MKKILFIMRYPLEDKYNLKQKFDGQLKAAVNLGYEVHHIAYDRNYTYLVNINSGTKKILGKTHFGSFNKYRNTMGFVDLFAGVLRSIKENDYTLAYMRSKLVNYTAVKAIKNLHKKGGKLIVEIPSYLSDEYIPLHRKIIFALLNIFKNSFEKQVDLYTLIGPEGNGSYKGKPAINIENSVCLDTIPARVPQLNKDEFHVLALAGMRNWQAYDRLITGLSQYKGDKNIVIDMVGGDYDGSLAKWKALSEELGISNKVIIHGALYEENLTNIINRSNIGVGTLGMHRKSFAVASPLKTREYVARGLPFIYAYTDNAFKGDEPFVMKVSFDDTPINFDLLLEWYALLAENENLIVEMRKFAQDNMSWESQFKKVFEKVLP